MTSQSGVQNDADIMQTGSNAVTVTQNGDKSTADVDQNGSGNTGSITQTDNSSIVPNTTHTAVLDQDGTDNQATITQTNLNSAIVNNGDDADVEQDGSNHIATVSQSGARDQYAEINQVNSGGSALGNEAIITQSGSRASQSYVDQVGEDNFAYNYQRAGNFNSSDIDQDGSGNIANVLQDRDAPGDDVSPVLAHSWVDQDGFGNDANVNQSLQVNAEAHVTQDGTGNMADIDQWNTIQIDPSHYASVTQTNGDLNFGRVEQGGDTNARNWASITQMNGDSNTAFVDQQGLGGDHMATVTQDGNSNRVEGLGGLGTAALQDGFDHTLTISQTGDLNVAQVGQQGSGNTATITQN